MNDYTQYLIDNVADLVIILAVFAAAWWIVTPRKKGRK